MRWSAKRSRPCAAEVRAEGVRSAADAACRGMGGVHAVRLGSRLLALSAATVAISDASVSLPALVSPEARRCSRTAAGANTTARDNGRTRDASRGWLSSSHRRFRSAWVSSSSAGLSHPFSRAAPGPGEDALAKRAVALVHQPAVDRQPQVVVEPVSRPSPLLGRGATVDSPPSEASVSAKSCRTGEVFPACCGGCCPRSPRVSAGDDTQVSTNARHLMAGRAWRIGLRCVVAAAIRAAGLACVRRQYGRALQWRATGPGIIGNGNRCARAGCQPRGDPPPA